MGPSIRRAVRAQGVEVDLRPLTGTGPNFTETLIRCSSLLIALWDGTASSMPDDTADTVFRFLGVRTQSDAAIKKIEIAKASENLEASTQLVYWVPVLRGPETAAGARNPCFLLGAGENVVDMLPTMPAPLQRRLAELNEFNSEFERFTRDGSLARTESLMLDLSAPLAVHETSWLQNIDRQYIKADSLAGYMQRRSDRLFNLFGAMAFTMGLAYLIYDKITESNFLLVAYMVILSAGLLAYYLFQDKHWFAKHLAYRALAETLRVHFYLSLAGLERRMHTRELLALTGIHSFRGFGWISLVLDAIEPTKADAPISRDAYLRRSNLVDQAWIENQHRYFVRKVASMERDSHHVKRLKGALFFAILFVISVMFIFGAALNRVDTQTGLPLKNLLTFCSGFLAVLLGTWEIHHNKMATRELLWQYRSQLTQFSRAKLQLSRITSRAMRDDLLMDLGENSLMETYLWTIHRYHREHAPPAAV